MSKPYRLSPKSSWLLVGYKASGKGVGFRLQFWALLHLEPWLLHPWVERWIWELRVAALRYNNTKGLGFSVLGLGSLGFRV